MAALDVTYRVLVLPLLFIYRLVKAIVVTPVYLLLSVILLPFRLLASVFGSLWWFLPYRSRESAANPPTPTEFLLASLVIGVVAGLILHFTCRILFALPDIMGMSPASIAGAGEKLVPSPRQVRQRIREQARKVQLIQDIEPPTPTPVRIQTAEEPGAPTVSQHREQQRPARTPAMQGHGTAMEAGDWDSRWQFHQDSSLRSPSSPTAMLSPTSTKGGMGVAGQTILEEDSSAEDTDYF